jgi:hypothetical protein
MAETSSIDLKRLRPLSGEEAHMVEAEAVNRMILDHAACFFEPFPNVSVALRRVAGAAGRHDVIRLRQAASGYGDDVIPGLGLRVAVGAKAAEFFEDHAGSLRRNRRHPAPSEGGAIASPLPEERVIRITRGDRGVLAHSAISLLRYLIGWKPCLAAATPALARNPALSSLAAPWPRGRSLVPAFAANIGAPIETRSVEREGRKGLELFAFRAPLLTVGTALDIAAVFGSAVLRLTHGSQFIGFHGDRKAAGRLLDSVEHNGLPA